MLYLTSPLGRPTSYRSVNVDFSGSEARVDEVPELVGFSWDWDYLHDHSAHTSCPPCHLSPRWHEIRPRPRPEP